MSRIDELKSVIAEAVKAEVEKAVQPLQEKATNWSEIIAAAGAKSLGERMQNDKEARSIAAARLVRAYAASKGDIERAQHFAKKAWSDDLGKVVAATFEKAMAAGDFTGGGFMIPPEFSDQIIDLLRPRSVVRAMGTPTVPMPRGTLTIPKQTGDVSASYVGENQDITQSAPAGGQIVLSAKKLAALVPVSNDLLMASAGDSADRFIRDSLVRHIATREDRAFIRDEGVDGTPKGLRYWAKTTVASSGTTAANIESDLVSMINTMESANVDMSNPVWLMSPRSKNKLLTLRDGSGNLIYPEIRPGSDGMSRLYGWPVFTTTNIPTNLGGGSDSEVYLVNVPDLIIAEQGGMEITASEEASYVEGANLASAFSRDQTVIRAIVRHDFAVQYPEAVVVMTGVQW